MWWLVKWLGDGPSLVVTTNHVGFYVRRRHLPLWAAAYKRAARLRECNGGWTKTPVCLVPYFGISVEFKEGSRWFPPVSCSATFPRKPLFLALCQRYPHSSHIKQIRKMQMKIFILWPFVIRRECQKPASEHWRNSWGGLEAQTARTVNRYSTTKRMTAITN